MVLLRGVSSPFRENCAPAGDIYSFPSGARNAVRARAASGVSGGDGRLRIFPPDFPARALLQNQSRRPPATRGRASPVGR